MITGDTTGNTTDQGTTVSGSISISDADSGENPTISNTSIEGEYGSLTLTDGDWTYTVDPDKAQVLPDGESANDTFTLTASDGSTHQITVNVEGSDQAAVVTGTTTGSISTDSLSTMTVGNAFIMDENFNVDSGEFHTFNFPPSINFSSGGVNVTFNDNDTRLDGDNIRNEFTNDSSQSIELNGVTYPANLDYTLQYSDAQGNIYTMAIVDVDTNADGNNYNSLPDNGKVLIQLSGPEITPDTTLELVANSYNNIDSLNYEDIAAPVTVSGTIAITDIDSDDTPTFTNTTIAGEYGSLTLTDGEWTYTADRGKLQSLGADDNVQDVITLTASDGTTQDITISLSGTDDDSIIAGDISGSITEDTGAQTASGTITITDPDSGQTPTIPNGTLAGEYGSLTLVDGAWTYTADSTSIQSLADGDTATDTITVTASDGTTQDIVITITGTDDAAVITGDTSGTLDLSTDTPTSSDAVFTPETNTNNVVFSLAEYATDALDDASESDDRTTSVKITSLPEGGTLYFLDENNNEVEVALDQTLPDSTQFVFKPQLPSALYTETDITSDSQTQIIENGITLSGVIFTGDKPDANSTLSETTLVFDDANAEMGVGIGADKEINANSNEALVVDFGEALNITDANVSLGSLWGHYDADGVNATVIVLAVKDGEVVGEYAFDDLYDGSGEAVINITNSDGFDELRLYVESPEVSNYVVQGVEVINAQPTTSLTYQAVDSDGNVSPVSSISLSSEGSETTPPEKQTLTVTGSLTITDIDEGENPSFINTTLIGEYGTLVLVEGNWTYTVDPEKAQPLGHGVEDTDVFTVTATDGTTQNVTITLTGTNDLASITGDATGTVSDSDAFTSGTITVVDPDTGDTTTIANTSIVGDYGTFSLTNGNWTYTVDPAKAQPLPEGQTETDTFTLTASDGSTHDIVVSVVGTDNAAVVTGTTSGSVDAGGFKIDVEGGSSISADGDAVSSDSNSGWTTTTTTIDGVPYVISTQFSVNGVTIISRVENDGSLTETDRITYDQSAGTVISQSLGDITSLLQSEGIAPKALGSGLHQSNVQSIDGQEILFLTSQNSGSITTWEISPDGQLSLNGGLSQFGHSQPGIRGGIVRESVVFEAEDGTDLVYVSRPQSDTIDILTFDAETGSLQETGTSIASIDGVSGIDIISVDGNAFVVASGNGGVSLYSVNSADGNLTQVDSESVTAGGGSAVNFYQNADGTTYAIVSSSSSGETSVFEVSSDGSLSLTDTHTGAGAYMSTAGYIDGVPVFVTPNETSGVDLYTLSSDGDLVHQGHIAGIENDYTPPVIVQTADGSYFLVDADGNAATVKLDIGTPEEVTVSGSIAISDIDADDTPSFANTTVEGQYGTLVLTDGTWTYTLDESKSASLGEDQTALDTITLTASDGTTQDIVITVTGTDARPVVTGDTTGAITEDVGAQTASGTLTITDPDSNQAPTFTNSTISGDYGSLTIAANGAWTYTVDSNAVQSLAENETALEEITVTASDGTEQVISITLTGTDDAAVISGTTSGNVSEGDLGDVISTSGTLSVSDEDSTVTLLNSTQTGDYGSFSMVNGEWTYTLDNSKADSLNADQQVTDTFTVTASDGTEQEVVINITGSDDAAVLSGDTTSTISNFTSNTFNTTLSRDSNGTWDVGDGDSMYLNISNVQTSAAYQNSVGYYVLDGSGNVVRSAILFDNAHNTNGTSININTAGGEKVGLFMIPNGNSQGFNNGSVTLNFSGNGVTATQGRASGTTFVSESSKNGSGFDYEQNSGTSSRWEDILGGGDRDFNDVTFTVTASQQQTQAVTASGSISVSDVDSADNPTLPNTTVQGEYGTLVLTNGNWTYTFDDSKKTQIDDETLETIIITDSEGGKHEIVIALEGTDDAPVVTGVFTGAVTEGDYGDSVTVSGSIAINDPDADDTPEFLNTTIEGEYGILTLSDGVWTYELDDVKAEVLSSTDHVTDSITLTATDGTVQNINISISGTNDNPFVVGTNNAAIVAPDTVTQEYVDINNAFVLNEGYTYSGGDMQYYGNEPTFRFNDSGSTIRFYDNDNRVDGDTYRNEYSQDSNQKVEINGVLYVATYDYQLDYQDSAGNIYSFAVFDVDLDRDGSFIYDANEQGRVIVQIDGPQITPGLTMDYVRDTPNQPTSMSYSDFTDLGGASLEARGTLSIVDLDGNESQATFADTTVNGQYGSLALVNGNWTYTLDPRSTPSLGDHDTVNEVITLTATNGAQTQVNVTIGGSESAVSNAVLDSVSNSLSDVIALDDITFSGSDSNDRVAGSDTADVLLGNAGNDIIYGNSGADIIDGGLGDDLIFGGAGNDLMAGGSGSDTFAFLSGEQGSVNNSAVDHIADFDVAHDALNLSDLLNNETEDTLESYLSIVDDGEGHAMLSISSNGDGNVDQQVVFDNMSVEDMASAYSVDISGMTSEQISSSVIDAMIMQSKMIID
ncbi:VCBS domain-containing protein [Enterovibrio sp. ZSDZ35]|uniref:VCBS domain-containing protein n=1 Tax=Enterovibrio qingdaonensis TaxID=2899818 RepID=A0ABT5QTT8_9GAMM|nr:VCBS domain-containing protein [Enterovibrio sp. ZSDZ35]